ncbi:hypothetical protein A0H81_14126 [Grifola frondosa]|uniref:Signal recognition particle subunit SRP72 n=1 Tax=Grifola frondosa TaxID=5627 RepID=A0A1C7LPA2_GRIFR|nr:hypothetical protein A0H81_14126 [Grifola frondosa]
MGPKTITSTKSNTSNKNARQNATPKQPLPVTDRLKRLFTSLCAQIEGGHLANAIKTCDKILHLNPHDQDALQTKLFLLLQTDQYSAALSMISGDGTFSEYAFEKAYSLYRLHHESEAREVLNVIKKKKGEDDRGVLHLDAQLTYRQGSYQAAFDIYNQLLDTAEPNSEEQSDILTNLEASQKHLDFIDTDFLRVLDTLPSALTSGLETAPPPQQPSSLAALASVSADAAKEVRIDDDTTKKIKEVRMKRVPAGVIPGVTPPPDPERWLKKSERSNLGQGGKRRKGAGGRHRGLSRVLGWGARALAQVRGKRGNRFHKRGDRGHLIVVLTICLSNKVAVCPLGGNFRHAPPACSVRDIVWKFDSQAENAANFMGIDQTEFSLVLCCVTSNAVPTHIICRGSDMIANGHVKMNRSSKTRSAAGGQDRAGQVVLSVVLHDRKWARSEARGHLELARHCQEQCFSLPFVFQQTRFLNWTTNGEATIGAHSVISAMLRVEYRDPYSPQVSTLVSACWALITGRPTLRSHRPAQRAFPPDYKAIPITLIPPVSFSRSTSQHLTAPLAIMSHPEVHGVVVLARNGDRTECYQDPITYKPGSTASTPSARYVAPHARTQLEADHNFSPFQVQSHQLGTYLRETYLNSGSSSHIKGITSDLVNLNQVHVRVKVGGEGASVFDSATALLQGLFPPNPNNKILLANETTIVAPLGGYQYIPVETVEPSNDRSLEPWTDCPAFEKHVAKVQASAQFKEVAKKAQSFYGDLRDYLFGRQASLENSYNIHDYVASQLTHKTFAHRLPPTFVEQTRGFADFRENAVFSDSQMGGIVASRTALSSVLKALQRISFNGDPLQFMLIETTYQPFISFFHQTDVIKSRPELAAIPDFGSALAIELRRAHPPEVRDFLRFQFKNGTNEEFETIHVFGHHEDIPLTEFIYRLENSVIHSNGDWARACHAGSASGWIESASTGNTAADAVFGIAFAFLLMFGMWFATKSLLRVRRRRSQVRLNGVEDLPQSIVVVERQNEKASVPSYGAL